MSKIFRGVITVAAIGSFCSIPLLFELNDIKKHDEICLELLRRSETLYSPKSEFDVSQSGRNLYYAPRNNDHKDLLYSSMRIDNYIVHYPVRSLTKAEKQRAKELSIKVWGKYPAE